VDTWPRYYAKVCNLHSPFAAKNIAAQASFFIDCVDSLYPLFAPGGKVRSSRFAKRNKATNAAPDTRFPHDYFTKATHTPSISGDFLLSVETIETA